MEATTGQLKGMAAYLPKLMLIRLAFDANITLILKDLLLHGKIVAIG